MSQNIKNVSGVKDSTLYPILKRLQEQGFLSVYDQPFQGRNRRYYRITDSGRQRYRELMEEWQLHKEAIDQILKGEMKE